MRFGRPAPGCSRRSVLLWGGLGLAGWAGLVPGRLRAQPRPEPLLHWVGGDLPPFVWQADGRGQGYAHDLALAMARRLGRPEQVQFFPWARAVKLTAEGEPYGVFPLARTPDREQGFRWLIPLQRVDYTLFVRAAAPPELGLESLKTHKVVVLRGSPIINNLRAAGFQQLTDATSYRDMLRMLDEGMVAAAYAGRPMLRAAMREAQLAPARYREVANLGEAVLYMACSLSIGAEEAQRWVEAHKALEADGTAARLRERYGL